MSQSFPPVITPSNYVYHFKRTLLFEASLIRWKHKQTEIQLINSIIACFWVTVNTVTGYVFAFSKNLVETRKTVALADNRVWMCTAENFINEDIVLIDRSEDSVVLLGLL